MRMPNKNLIGDEEKAVIKSVSELSQIMNLEMEYSLHNFHMAKELQLTLNYT